MNFDEYKIMLWEIEGLCKEATITELEIFRIYTHKIYNNNEISMMLYKDLLDIVNMEIAIRS
jgi:hypothetical protein